MCTNGRDSLQSMARLSFILCHYLFSLDLQPTTQLRRRYQWPHGLRRRFAAARLLRLWIRISPWAWMSVCCECCVLPGRGLCDELITRPEESYFLWCVVVCDLDPSWMRSPWPTGGGGGCRANNKQTKHSQGNAQTSTRNKSTSIDAFSHFFTRYTLLGAFAKLRKAAISFVMSVRPSA
jgi:hypothetical protein